MVRRLFLPFIICVVTFTTGVAQTVPSVISQHYTTDEGLPSNNVMCALKDRLGFLWFGTWYGLSRFDGVEFKTYNQPMRADSIIPPRKVESMAEDGQGCLWLKTVDWKVYVFNPRTERFHAVYDRLKQYAKNLQVIKIQQGINGRILLLTKDKTLLEAWTEAKGSTSIRRLYDAHGHTDPQTFQLLHDINTESRDYHIHIGCDYRLFVMPKSKTANFDEAMTHDAARQSEHERQKATLAHEAGIDRYLQLYQDRDSLLWVTTASKGIYCVSRPRQQFSMITLPEGDLTGVRSIYQTRQGDIIVGTRSRNVYIFNQAGKHLHTLDYASYGIGAVYHATEDRQGRLFLSTKGDGLAVTHTSQLSTITQQPTAITQHLTHYRHDPADPASLSSNNVYMTFVDSKGHIWVGTLDGGLNLVKHEADGRLTFWNKNNGFVHYPAYGLYSEVRNITEDANGRIWVGTIDGLMSFHNDFKKPQDIVFHTSHNTPRATFANNDIYTLHRDQNGKLWVGAFGGGLQQLVSVKNGQPVFQPLGSREGLRNDVIYSITEDLHGHLWFATETGLACYDRQTGRVRNIDRYDGLPDLQMEEAAAACMSDGRLWIGSKQGILTFNPNELHTGHDNYRTFILELIHDNQTYTADTALPYAKHIELEYDQNAFTIEFAALNYLNHGNVNYRYRLEGFDRDWRYSGTHRVASYNEVPPGRYTFTVEAIDNANPTLLSSPGPSGTNIIIGSIAGAVLVAAIVLGGTGWGFK